MPQGFNGSYLNNTDSSIVSFNGPNFKGYSMFVRSDNSIVFAFSTNAAKGVYNYNNNKDYVAGTYQENGMYGTFYYYNSSGVYQSNSALGINMQAATYKYIFTTNPITTSNVNMVRNSETENIIYSPFSVTSTFEDISVDNVQNKAFRLDYNQSFTLIGHVEDIPSGTHFINLTFSQVGGGLFIRDTLNMYNMYNSSEDFYIDENYDIYIRNRLLTYNIKYLLTCDAFTDSTLTTQTGNYELNYYTITMNAVINGGIITSFGSGDYSIQNSVNDTIDFYNDDTLVNNELDSFFSGDTSAIVSNLNFPNLENNYYVVIYNVVSGISDTLQMSGDPYFDVSLHGETPKRIYASDFTTPPSVLKTFISMSLIFGTLYILYLQLSGFIMLINTGHVKDAINQIDDVSGATLYKM